MGRAMRDVIRAGGRVAIPVYNIYGFPGGHHDKETASRTNAIVEAVVQDTTQRGDIYASIVGDLNADTCDLPAVTELLQTQGWTDLGAHPKWLAGRPPTPTCFVANHAGTRRDFILADAHLMTMPLAFGLRRILSQFTSR